MYRGEVKQMNYLLIIPRALWKTFFILNFVLGLIVLYPFFFILLSKRKWFPLAYRLKRFWARWIMIVPLLFYKITWKTKKENLPQPCIYCANHASYLDIVLSYLVIPKFFVFMGKQELDRVPLFRIFFKDMNILVNRQNLKSSHRAFVRAGVDIDRGQAVFIFPEAGISSSGKLRGFKNGAFKLAIEKQIPVVPITYLNNWKLIQNGGFFKTTGKPGISRVVVHPPISTIGMSQEDLIPLRTQVYNIIQNELNNHTNENR